MAKPIFILEMPNFYIEFCNDIEIKLKKQLTDYHVLVMATDVTETKYTVFYEKDFTEINYNELKNIITIAKKIN